MPDPDTLISYQLSVSISDVDFLKRDPLIIAFDSLVVTKPDAQVMVEKFNRTLFLGAEIETDPSDPMDLPRIIAILAEYLWDAHGGFLPLSFHAVPLISGEGYGIAYNRTDYDAFIDEKRKKKGTTDAVDSVDNTSVPLAPGGIGAGEMDWQEL